MANSDPFKDYLYAISRFPLLTPKEEIELGKLIQGWLNHPEPVPPAIANRGKMAHDRMVRANLRLVVSVAKKYCNRGIEMFDLVQEGSLGLSRAAEKFDPLKGYRFSTYAYWWIRQAITRAICQQSRAIRLPVHITEKLNKIKIASCRLKQQLGRSPSVDEIIQALGWDFKDYEKVAIADRTSQSYSLNRLVKQGDEDTELIDLIPATPENEDIEHLNELLSALLPIEAEVLCRRWGVAGYSRSSIGALVGELKISHQQIKNLENAAIRKIKEAASVA